MGTLMGTSMKSRIEAYFTACDETAERIVLKNGGVTVRQTPYTLSGLSEHLGMSQAEIRARANRGKYGIDRMLAGAMRRIERYIVERALLGELQSSVAAAQIGGLALGGCDPSNEDDARVVIVLEDPEGWSE